MGAHQKMPGLEVVSHASEGIQSFPFGNGCFGEGQGEGVGWVFASFFHRL
jgi:hypothetical protein